MAQKQIVQKLYLVYGVVFTVLGLIALFLKNDLIEYLRFPPLTVLTISVFIFLMGVSFLAMLYVRGDLSKSISDVASDLSSDQGRELKSALKQLREDFEKYIVGNKGQQISGDDVKSYLDEKIASLSEEKLISLLTEKFKSELVNRAKLELVEVDIDSTKIRIEKESIRISRFGLINLMVGLITTGMAIFLLGYSLLGAQTKGLSTQDYIFHIVPRISLSILIEVFSFFFLRLYKKNLDDIKYLSNERTNIEMKMIALRSGIITEDKELLNSVSKVLAETERNFVLKKDESTVEIEKSKLEVTNSNNFIAGLIKVLEKK
jgi:hypothetical protein